MSVRDILVLDLHTHSVVLGTVPSRWFKTVACRLLHFKLSWFDSWEGNHLIQAHARVERVTWSMIFLGASETTSKMCADNVVDIN